MGQKANTLTLRKNNESLNFTSLNAKEFTNALEFIKMFKKSLDKKGIIVTKNNFNFVGNTSYLSLDLFYKTKKLANYKKFTIDSSSSVHCKKEVVVEKKLSVLFNNLVKTKKIILKIVVINKELKENRKNLTELYLKFNEYKNKLFSRRFNLFLDFIKLTYLIQKKKISASIFVPILGTIFKILPKRLHSAYFKFVKSLIEEVLLEQKKEEKDRISKIVGVKLLINGKLKGKLRSSSLTINKGRIGAQVLSNDIEFAKVHVNTMYGCFGFQF